MESGDMVQGQPHKLTDQKGAMVKLVDNLLKKVVEK